MMKQAERSSLQRRGFVWGTHHSPKSVGNQQLKTGQEPTCRQELTQRPRKTQKSAAYRIASQGLLCRLSYRTTSLGLSLPKQIGLSLSPMTWCYGDIVSVEATFSSWCQADKRLASTGNNVRSFTSQIYLKNKKQKTKNDALWKISAVYIVQGRKGTGTSSVTTIANAFNLCAFAITQITS